MTSDSGRVWLVTGCDSGMGHHIAETALKNGDSVAATILAKGDTGPLSEKYGNRCRYYHLDVRDTAMVKEVVARAERDFGRIDVLMNNAGYGLHGALEETAEDADPDHMPVTCMVSALLKGAVGLEEAKDLLLSRPLRRERG